MLYGLVLMCTVYTTAHAQKKDKSAINTKQFERKMKKVNAVVVDVRTAEEYSAGHIPGALHMDVQKEDFNQLIQTLDPSKKYLLYCKSGKRSARATAIFNENGFTDVHHLQGGIQKWKGTINNPE